MLVPATQLVNPFSGKGVEVHKCNLKARNTRGQSWEHVNREGTEIQSTSEVSVTVIPHIRVGKNVNFSIQSFVPALPNIHSAISFKDIH